MSIVKIFLYHVLVFVLGFIGIALYFFLKFSALSGGAGLAVIALLPVAIVYITGFGILCFVSLIIFLLLALLRRS